MSNKQKSLVLLFNIYHEMQIGNNFQWCIWCTNEYLNMFIIIKEGATTRVVKQFDLFYTILHAP